MGHTLFDLIEPSVRNYPDRTALVLSRQTHRISYRQLANIVDTFAARAAEYGISKGHVVAVQTIQWWVSLCLAFALSKLGAIRAPAPDPGSSRIGDYEVDYIIAEPSAGRTGDNVITWTRSWLEDSASGSRRSSIGHASLEDIAIIFPSSGTTGQRKLFGANSGFVRQNLAAFESLLGPLDGPTLVKVPPTTSFGFIITLLTLKSAGQVVWKRAAPAVEVGVLANGEIDHLAAAPVAYADWVKVARTQGVTVDSIKSAVMAGSVASRSLIEGVQKYICRKLFNVYGSVELGMCASARVDDVASVSNGVGHVVSWIEPRIVDEEGQELKRGVSGHLQFRMKEGYYAPVALGELSSESFATSVTGNRHWVSPGDVGTVTSDNVLRIEGRSSDVINMGGNKIAPSVVEDLVVRLLGSEVKVCAVGMAGPSGFDEVVVAVERLKDETADSLEAQLRGGGRSLRQVRVVSVSAFPENEFGKIDRSKLREIVRELI